MADTVKLLFFKPSKQRRNSNTTPRVVGEVGHGAAPAHGHYHSSIPTHQSEGRGDVGSCRGLNL